MRQVIRGFVTYVIRQQKVKCTKCNQCNKTMHYNQVEIKCHVCNKYYHSKCANVSFEDFKQFYSWVCDTCDICDTLPFSALDNNKLYLSLQAKDLPISDNISISQSFTIKTLLDKIPGHVTIQTQDFLSDTIN